jgi:aspartate 1-decarboxylase
VVFVDAENTVVGTGSDPAAVVPGSGLARGDELAVPR